MATCDPILPIPTDTLPVIPVSNINTATVTEGCVDGAGIYDVFMQAHLDAIHQEWIKQRLTGVDYSKVYLGGMQAAMQQAVVFALGKDQAAAQTELMRYQMLKMASDIALVDAQVCLTENQIDEIIQNIKESEKRIEETEGKIKLLEIQGMVELAKIHDVPNLAVTDTLAEFRTDANDLINGVNLIGGVFGGQINKTKREEFLLKQKEQTEQAQIKEEVFGVSLDGAIGYPGIPVAGVVRKEKNLLQRQSDGFLRDAEAKVAKLAVDAFAVQYSTSDGLENFDSEFNAWNGSIAPALLTAIQNVNKAEHADSDVNDNTDNAPSS